LSDLRGVHQLAHDVTIGLTDLVEAMHHTVAKTPGVFDEPPSGRTTGITGFVYNSVRGVTRVVGIGIDALFGMLAPMLEDQPSSQAREAVLSALNGVFGDYLAASGNPLTISMAVRRAGIPASIALYPQPGRKVVVLLHGLCMNDLQWLRDGHDHGAALARDLGYTPVYLHYNTGRHVSTNGREFADLMEALLDEWPCPIEHLAIIGHSMGGLVARSACHYAKAARHDWLTRLDALIFLGTPHHGAPLERAGAWADLLIGISPYTAPFARLGKARSAGIKDLRYGHVRDEDWQPHAGAVREIRRSVALPKGVACYAIAASNQQRPARPGSRMRGDGLVPVTSALGRHRDAALDLAIPEAHQWIGFDMGHLDLLNRIEVYERITSWLTE
jgi:pimeloyl-ACP methyl ester carboxylesterase